MTKFKKGDRVRNLVADGFLKVGDVGTVMDGVDERDPVARITEIL